MVLEPQNHVVPRAGFETATEMARPLSFRYARVDAVDAFGGFPGLDRHRGHGDGSGTDGRGTTQPRLSSRKGSPSRQVVCRVPLPCSSISLPAGTPCRNAREKGGPHIILCIPHDAIGRCQPEEEEKRET